MLKADAIFRAVQVPAGFDVADNHIAQQAQPGDIVVTADIPLAAQVVAKGALALNPRGELYSDATIREALALRGLRTLGTRLRRLGERLQAQTQAVLAACRTAGVKRLVYFSSVHAFTTKPLEPKFERLNPVTNAAQLFSKRSLVKTIVNSFKMALVMLHRLSRSFEVQSPQSELIAHGPLRHRQCAVPHPSKGW